ncbi:MAG: hypothetical protein COZ16_11150 [Flavobacteriaceae bacterium CG_4_10_14_3_um_filter_31_253]|nr:MAG: hypothetical protein COZ74_13560 [Flavobacteriaceae bacterium CG_4_8_14_3_um_filter_31_8]PIY14029.1 MAG: hypothetical protein COZ16_11150 [Flavobacteriaceae bacterium CG_4_10_14_3_um_filter_31_253]PIZ09340.1 MAG: hypothetical protein COY55_13205 [Flavobacteriaceae bacterium CG_4_10_14_0_8_um_filter_31_99]PJC10625.1 MAG: hypothetical protein CO067_03545 [Flavobacteriaceae bacterium CG_4_9_14_0_8_um_filter_31_91]
MHSLLDERINDFNDVLCSNNLIYVEKENLVSFFKSLTDLDVVILHKSYVFSDKNITPYIIKDIVKKLNKKFVLFSGGLENAIIDDNEIVLNSGTLYKNLNFFIDNYRNNKDANLVYLVFNNQNEYLKHQIKKLQNSILPDFIKFNNENAGVIFKKTRNKIENYLISSEFSDDKIKIIEYINKKIETKDFNHSILFQQIQKMMSKYENN